MTNSTAPLSLGYENISKLMKQYAIPAIVAMTAAALYNMIDTICIGHALEGVTMVDPVTGEAQSVGHLALAGLSVTFPFMNLAAAFGALVGVGASTLISVKLGQKDYNTSQLILGNVVTLNLLIGILFSLVSWYFLDPILVFFGASEATLPYARDYMEVILLGNVVTHFYFGLNAVLRASGHPRIAMMATIFTVMLNTALDILFIFGFHWGIRGAALATLLAQVVALIWQVYFFSNSTRLIHFKRGTYRLEWKLVREILAIGMSPFLMNATACFIILFINNSLARYGGELRDYYIAAYGIVNRIVFLFLMVVMGLNQGMQPIAGYNYGAKLYGRVRRVLYITISYAVAVTTIGFLCAIFIPEYIASIFTSNEQVIELAAEGFSISTLSFMTVGFQMVASNFFQSIGLAKKSIFLSLTRQLIYLLPLLYLLPQFFGPIGVWMSMPISDFLASITAAVMLWYQFRFFRKQEANLLASENK